MTNQQFLKIVLLGLFPFFLWSQTLSDKSLLPYDTIDNNYFKD
ncbi:hypothetical protein FVB9288_03147 [Flavobacterium sp. CECT 9288]|nr:hypothetical protein [Flavobacterium sp. CECT 9288]CAH0337388.1 hypothetical protein FVB9288_03147 [Flavobacterium sp. CECT 9288]